jgi:hypothetical protein
MGTSPIWVHLKVWIRWMIRNWDVLCTRIPWSPIRYTWSPWASTLYTRSNLPVNIHARWVRSAGYPRVLPLPRDAGSYLCHEPQREKSPLQ